MNEKILALAKECGLSISQAYSAEFKKFAESIWEEAYQEGFDKGREEGFDDGYDQAQASAERHYGVEE